MQELVINNKYDKVHFKYSKVVKRDQGVPA